MTIEFLPFHNTKEPGKFRAYQDAKNGVVLFIERVFGTFEVYGVLFGPVPTSGVSSFYHTYNDLRGGRCIIYQHNNGQIFELSSRDCLFVNPSDYFQNPR